MRHAAKRDANEAELAKIPPLYGWTLRKLSDTGKPDWLCMRRGQVVFIEIKDKDGTLTPAQAKEFPLFEAAGCKVHVCRTEDDVRRALGAPIEGVLEPLPFTEPILWVPEGVGLARWASRDELEARYGHVVTPAYQKAQTEAVVPKKRRKTT